jgi:GntR family transcriptional regulator, transcriptional repressor for pyruvate dehydrogenase complex
MLWQALMMKTDLTNLNTKLKRPKSLPEEVTKILRAEIDKGTFKPGQVLPTEAALSKNFGISRTVVREALAQLKSDGLIETSQGYGAVVNESWKRKAFRFDLESVDSKEGLSQLFELRAILESEAASLAALRRNKGHLRKMRICLGQMLDAVTHSNDGTMPDFEFHRLIADAADNMYLIQFMQMLNYRIIEQIRKAREHSMLRSELPLEVQKEHESIFKAIKAGNKESARKATLAHIIQAGLRLDLSILDGR